VGSARGVRLAVWPRYIHFAMVRGTRVGGLGVLCAALAVTSGSAGPAIANPSKVRLVVAPSTVLVDQRLDVRLSGLRAKQRVRLSAATRDAIGRTWRSQLTFRATRRGVVHTRRDMKLFWSMRPPKGVEGVPLVPPLSPTDVRITAEIGGRTVASTRFTRTAKAEDVTAEAVTLSREGFVGTYYHLPPGPPAPAVLQIGGSFGGHSPLPAALVASRGYPTLSLAYFNEPGLPTALKDIPLEYFERALRWLAARPGVDPRRLIVAGASRGGEAALLLGTVYTDLVHGVMACTTSASVLGAYPVPGNAWTFRGQPLPVGGPIPVERINGPVLATGGGRDAVIGSARAVEEIVRRARRYGRRDIIGHIYPRAGHSVGCAIPFLPQPAFRRGRDVFVPLGGTLADNALARAASWPRLFRFLATVR
jgi:dienelactone hydrolase